VIFACGTRIVALDERIRSTIRLIRALCRRSAVGDAVSHEIRQLTTTCRSWMAALRQQRGTRLSRSFLPATSALLLASSNSAQVWAMSGSSAASSSPLLGAEVLARGGELQTHQDRQLVVSLSTCAYWKAILCSCHWRCSSLTAIVVPARCSSTNSQTRRRATWRASLLGSTCWPAISTLEIGRRG
jgi:hypothetical protein